MHFLEESPRKFLLLRHIFVDTTNTKLFNLKVEIALENYQIRYIGEQVAMIQSLQTWYCLRIIQSG